MTALRSLAPLGLLICCLGPVGCSSDNTDGLAEGGVPICMTNDDCPSDQHCEASACVPGSGNECTDDDGCAAGQVCDIVTECGAMRCSGNTCVAATCEDDEDCAGDLICAEGLCAEPTRCDENTPCPVGSMCVDDICEPIEEVPCEGDDECEGDDICIFGTCQAPTACTENADCPGDLICIQDVCREPCTQDSDCGSALMWSCDQQTGQCNPRCLGDGMCPEGQFCDGGVCADAQCAEDADCNPPMEVCEGADQGRGRCVEVTPCGPDGECPTGFACDDTTNRCEPLPGCRTDRDCDPGAICEAGFCVPADSCTNASCPDGFDCVAEVCVPAVCRADSDCTATGEVCIAGACQVPPTPDFVTQVRIITPAGYVRPGTTYPFVALAQDQAGRVVPGVQFGWTSSSTTVATISADGIALGEASPGVTQIRASVMSSIGPVVSAPVTLTNLGPAPINDIRVTVVRQDNGLPVSGAQVEVQTSGGPLTATTDASGVALFAQASSSQPVAVTAAHAQFDWVTVTGVGTRDVRLALPPINRTDRVAGARGAVDLGQVTTTGALSLSLSGASLASPLLTSDPGQVFGGEQFNVEVPMIGNVPIPAGNTVSVEFMGFPINLKDTYYARAQPGLRALWSFGGRIDFGNSGIGLGDFQNLLAALLPFYQRFEHTVDPAITMLALPTVVDTNDIDGDGDTTEQVPDWAGFPNRALTPSQSQNLRYQLTVDNLPFVSGGNANTLVVMAGVILPGVGFVPLGLDGQSDGMGSGIVSSFVSKMAAPHGGLEVGTYAVLVSAIRLDMGGAPGPGSTRLFTADRLPAAVDLSDGWLDSPVDATYSQATRQASLPSLPGTELYHLSFGTPDGSWHVYTPAATGVTTVTLPSAPAGLVDRAANAAVIVDAVDLDGAADPALLFDAAAPGALGLDRATRGFSRAALP